MTENAGAGPTNVPNVPPTGNVADDNVGTGNPADAGPTDHNPSSSASVSDETSRDEAFEQRRQEELAEARRVHAERGSEPDASQRLTVEHEGTGAGETPPPAGDLEEADGTDNA